MPHSACKAQVSYYFRPDRCVITFADVSFDNRTGSATLQLELFWKAGTLAQGSVRISWLGMADALAGLASGDVPLPPADAISPVRMPAHAPGACVLCEHVPHHVLQWEHDCMCFSLNPHRGKRCPSSSASVIAVLGNLITNKGRAVAACIVFMPYHRTATTLC